MAVIEVPIELIDSFYRNPERALRNFACITTSAIQPFFRRKDKVVSAVDTSRRNPFNDATLTFDPDWRCTDNYPRYIHVDLALTQDRIGIAMGHCPKFVSTATGERRPFVFIDFMGSIPTSPSMDVLPKDIRQIIHTELPRRGFYIALVTFDRFQSADSISILREHGIVSAVFSVDRTTQKIILDPSAKLSYRTESTNGEYTAAQEALRQALYEDRISVPPHPKWEAECFGAEELIYKKKVDHVPGGSLDMEQCVAAVAYHIVNNEVEYEETLEEVEEYEREFGDEFYDEYYEEEPC